MVERIVVGINGSGPSRAALQWAHRRAELSGAEVVGEHVEHERTAPELASAANADDLLVVGTHKTGFIHGRILGTLSIEIVAAAAGAVVVIPENNLTGRRGVVVGVKDARLSRRAVIAGAREAFQLKQALTLLHALADPSDGIEAGRRLLATAADLAAAAAPGVEIRTRISRRRCSEALLDASRTAVMLVVDGGRESGAAPNHLGSVTHEVLLNINAPVMVAR